MPFQKPCTTTRARSSRFRMLMSAWGSINAALGRLVGAWEVVMPLLSDREFHVIHQTLNHILNLDAFRFRPVIEKDAVSQGGEAQRLDVIHRYMRAAFE